MNRDKILKMKQKPHKFKKWWRKNGKYVMRTLLFFIWIPYLINQKLKEKRKPKPWVFDENKCKKYLDKVMPKMIVKYAEDVDKVLINTSPRYADFTFSDFRYDDKLFNKRQRRFFYAMSEKTLREYISYTYQIEGYYKMNLECWTDWEVVKHLGWEDNFNKDTDKGVLFLSESIKIL